MKNLAKRAARMFGWVLLLLPAFSLFMVTVRSQGITSGAGMIVTSVVLFATIYHKLRWVALLPFAIFSFGAYIQYLNIQELNDFFFVKGQDVAITLDEAVRVWLVYGFLCASFVVGDLLTDRGLLWGVRYAWKRVFVREVQGSV